MPRKAKSKASPKTGQNFWRLFGGIWSSAGALFLIIGIFAGCREHKLQTVMRESSTQIQGTVLYKSYDKESSPPSFHVDYRFFTPSERKIYGSAKVTPEFWDQLRELEPVRVFYLPTDPEMTWLDGVQRDYLLPYIFTGLGGLLTILGALILWRLGRRP